MVGGMCIKRREYTFTMTLQPILDSLYPNLSIPLEISTFIQSWAGTVPAEFRNIKKGIRFLNSVLGEVVEEENNKLGFAGLRVEDSSFCHFEQTEGGESFESPIIEIDPMYVRTYLYTKLFDDWRSRNTPNEEKFSLIIHLLISSQLIRNLVEKLNALVYERKSAPLNLSFQQAVKRREVYDDRSNPYPIGPWRGPDATSSRFRITVDKSAVCPVGSCPEYFTEKELKFYRDLPFWYTCQIDRARAQEPGSQIY